MELSEIEQNVNKIKELLKSNDFDEVNKGLDLLKKLDDEPNQTNPVDEIPADVKGAAAEGVTVEDGGNGAESEKAPSAAVASNTREPLLDSDNGNIFRRVLSLPKTMLYTEANKEGAAKELPTFSILYVFDETEKN